LIDDHPSGTTDHSVADRSDAAADGDLTGVADAGGGCLRFEADRADFHPHVHATAAGFDLLEFFATGQVGGNAPGVRQNVPECISVPFCNLPLSDPSV